MVPLQEYLILGAILFTIGVVGVITRTNVIVIFMSVELMLNAATLTFLAFSRVMNDMTGHVFAFMIMTVAAAEVAVGLAVVIALFRNRETVDVAEVNLLKG